MAPTSPTTQRSRRVRALAIGGIVLGLGAVATLATWTDQEWGTSPIAGGSFDLQGSTDGTAYADHESLDGAAQLTFSTGFDNLAPNASVSAPFHLRLAQGTTTGADVAVGAASTGTLTGLSYGIQQLDDAAACTPGATGTTVVPAGTPLDSAAGATGFALAQPADGAAGDATQLCITVSADDALAQAQQATGVWSFTATSN